MYNKDVIIKYVIVKIKILKPFHIYSTSYTTIIHHYSNFGY